jgi:hypothetical protein
VCDRRHGDDSERKNGQDDDEGAQVPHGGRISSRTPVVPATAACAVP